MQTGSPWVTPLTPFNPEPKRLDAPPSLPQFPDPPGSFDKPRCPKCGMQLESVMGYVCGDTYCPTFIKATC